MIRATVATLVLLAARAVADDGAVSLADLDAYRSALAAEVDAPATPISFRDLWDHPEKYAGRPVRVEGKVARRFRQDRVGEFPALVEAWIVGPAGDPTCLVYPDEPGRQAAEVGAEVRFAGTFLRKIRYRGGDETRLAPLVVGPAPPTEISRTVEDMRWPGSSIDWTVGLGGSALILLILLRRHLARPALRPAVIGPAPRFIDGADAEAQGADHDDP